MAVPVVKNLRRNQRKECGAQHDQGDRHIKKRHNGKNQKGRQDRDGELGQVLPEINLELLDALDHRHDGIAGALKPKVRRTQTRHLIKDHLPKMHLHPGSRVVGHHGPQVFQPAAHHHDHANAYKRKHQILNRRAFKDTDDQPAKKRQARNPE